MRIYISKQFGDLIKNSTAVTQLTGITTIAKTQSEPMNNLASQTTTSILLYRMMASYENRRAIAVRIITLVAKGDECKCVCIRKFTIGKMNSRCIET